MSQTSETDFETEKSATAKKSRASKKEQPAKKLEDVLWEAADKLRSKMDAAEYKHVVLGLIFLKYVSDVFNRRREEIAELIADPTSDWHMPTENARAAMLEDRDSYTAEGVFWIPEGQRWEDLRSAAKQADIGARIDNAMDAVEKENPVLRGVLPKNYARKELTPQTLGGLIDTFSREDLAAKEHNNLDVLGRVFEYFLSKFASNEGKLGGEFYTPRNIVQLLVELIEPFKGRVYDPAMGSGGMFVQAESFVTAHGGNRNDIAVYGQEQNPTTWRLAKMNLALRGIEANLGPKWGDTFLEDLHPDLRADYILANPPFNMSDWGADQLQTDARWKFGLPPASSANFAWLQHIVHHLSPTGTAAVVLANSSLSAERTGEKTIRQTLLEAGVVKCIIALPPNLFYTTSIPVCIWVLSKEKGRPTTTSSTKVGKFLVIDARTLGEMTSKTIRELRPQDISLISTTYHDWLKGKLVNVDIPGLAKEVDLSELKANDASLSPNLYVKPQITALSDEEISEHLVTMREIAHEQNSKRLFLLKQLQHAIDLCDLTEISDTDWLALSAEQLIEMQQSIFYRMFVSPIKNGGKLTPTEISQNPELLPPGWAVKKLSDVAQIVDCLHIKKPEPTDDDSASGALLEVSNITSDGRLDLSRLLGIAEDDYVEWTKNIELIGSDCVITNTGRVGAVARIPYGAHFAMGRNMTAIRAKSATDAGFLFGYLCSIHMKLETHRLTDIGTILDSLNVKGIKKARIVWPDANTRANYNELAQGIQSLIDSQSQLPTLALRKLGIDNDQIE